MIWKGNWIWLEEALQGPHGTLQARREFICETAPSNASIAITANQIYRLYINGELIGRGPDRADPRHPYFDVYDITGKVRAGANVVLCLLHHIVPTESGVEWRIADGPPGFLAQLDLNGRVIGTDADWRIRRAPGWPAHREIITRWTGYRHCVDLSFASELEAAAAPGYDDSAWPRPVTFRFAPDGPLPEPIPREIPFLVPTPREPLTAGSTQPDYVTVSNAQSLITDDPSNPATIKPVPEGAWLHLDFGRPMGGFPELAFESRGGGSVDVYYAEGAYWTLADRLKLPASGPAHYQPLAWRGARRIGLNFRDLKGPVVVRSARFIEMVYPYEPRGDFRCSDETLNRVWRVCRETAWACTKDHPMDCLNREQALWLADLNVHARAIAACFGDLRPAVKAMRQTLRVTRDDGIVPVPGPVALGYKQTGKTLPWSGQPLTLPMTLRDIYSQTGDAELLRFALPRIEGIFRHFSRYEDRRGLLTTQQPGLPSLTLFGGWDPMLRSGTPAWFSFEYAMSLEAGSRIANALGRDDLSQAWQAKAGKARAAARDAFWDPSVHAYFDGEEEGKLVEQYSPTANAWCALGGGVTTADAGSWAEAVRAHPAMFPPSTPYDATTLLDAFATLDLELHFRRLLDEYWGSIVRHNEPTLPERWQAGDSTSVQYKDDLSRCHPYGAGPAFLCLQYILGARPAAPGWKRAVIRPRACGLSFASGRVPTPHGEIRVAWEKQDTAWTLEVELPAPIQADVILPRLGWADERLLLNGKVAWESLRAESNRAQGKRRYVSHGPREARCTLTAPGRHILLLESY
jgi:hypothetical protein